MNYESVAFGDSLSDLKVSSHRFILRFCFTKITRAGGYPSPNLWGPVGWCMKGKCTLVSMSLLGKLREREGER